METTIIWSLRIVGVLKLSENNKIKLKYSKPKRLEQDSEECNI